MHLVSYLIICITVGQEVVCALKPLSINSGRPISGLDLQVLGLVGRRASPPREPEPSLGEPSRSYLPELPPGVL